MKRKMSFLMAALMLTSCFAQGVYASTVVAPASAGVIKSDRMLISVPSGEIFKLLGFDVTINGETITIKDSDHTVVLKNGESSFTTDGQAVTPDVPQQIISDSYYIPVRAIAESVGATVEWKAATKVAIITYKGKSISVRRDLVFGNAIYNAYLAQIKYEQANLSGDSKYDNMCKYSIYDIDNDGVPELITFSANELTYSAYEAPHAYVYKFENGEAVECFGEMKGTARLYEYPGKNAIISEIVLDGGGFLPYIIKDPSDGNYYIMEDPSSDEPVVGNEIPQYSITDTSGLDVLTVFSVISEDKVDEDIAEAYKKALAEAPTPSNWQKYDYFLYDIDKDGVPELSINYAQVGGEGMESLIYTYKDGKAQSCGYIPKLSSTGVSVDGSHNSMCGGGFEYKGGNGIYIQNDPVVHEVGIVTLNGTTLSTDGKLYSTNYDDTKVGSPNLLDLDPLYIPNHDLSDLTPIENLKS